MIITCPRCSTRYALSELLVRPNSKARCTYCKHVFILQEGMSSETVLGFQSSGSDANPTAQSEDYLSMNSLQQEEASSRRYICIAAVVIALLFAGLVFTFWHYMPRLSVDEAHVEQAAESQTCIDSIVLRGVQAQHVVNAHEGKLLALSGLVANVGNTSCASVIVEATLFDKVGNVLLRKRQLCGNTVSLVQMQMRSLRDLDAALNNSIGVLASNTDIRSGKESPFMVIFDNVPDTVAEYSVKVIEAQPSALQ